MASGSTTALAPKQQMGDRILWPLVDLAAEEGELHSLYIFLRFFE